MMQNNKVRFEIFVKIIKKLLLVIFIIGAINRPAYAQADSPYSALGHAIGTLIGNLIANMREDSKEEFRKEEIPTTIISKERLLNDKEYEEQVDKCLKIEDLSVFERCLRNIK